MQHHPDKNSENIHSGARFLDIQEAYSVLADPAKRDKYDKERWLNGTGNQGTQTHAITPLWLLDVSRKLNQSLAHMEHHNVSYGSLKSYILLILSDAHINVLLQQNDSLINTTIVREILKAAEHLDYHYLPEVLRPLYTISNGTNTRNEIASFEKNKKREALRNKLFPYVVLLITLALCLMMYFYGSIP